MKNNYDFTNAIKNPYAEKLKKDGYTVMIRYGSTKGGRDGAGEYEPLPDEAAAFEEHRASKSSARKRKAK